MTSNKSTATLNNTALKNILRSAIFALCALLLVVLVNFFLPRLMPGDPVLSLLGAEDEEMSQEEYDYYYHELGLDKPMAEQLGDYIANLFKGDMGYSFHYGTDVSNVIAQKMPRTLQVALPAWLISALLAYLLGTAAGYRRSRIGDTLLSDAAVLVNTVPTFLLAMIMVVVFAYKLHVLPYGNLNSTIAPDNGFLYFLDRLKHLILPVSTLVIASTPGKYLMMRNTTATAVDEKYVVYAKARGISGGRIRARHIFTNVGQPFISMLGTSLGRTLSGSIVVEMIFSIDGMGMLVGTAVSQRDFAVLQGALFIIAVAVIISNFASDVVCTLIDPKQRLGVKIK